MGSPCTSYHQGGQPRASLGSRGSKSKRKQTQLPRFSPFCLHLLIQHWLKVTMLQASSFWWVKMSNHRQEQGTGVTENYSRHIYSFLPLTMADPLSPVSSLESDRMFELGSSHLLRSLTLRFSFPALHSYNSSWATWAVQSYGSLTPFLQKPPFPAWGITTTTCFITQHRVCASAVAHNGLF